MNLMIVPGMFVCSSFLISVCMFIVVNGDRAPIAGGGRGRYNLHSVCHTVVTATPRVGCVVWSL